MSGSTTTHRARMVLDATGRPYPDLDELPAVIHPVQQKTTPCDFSDGLSTDPVNRAATSDLMHGTDCRGV